MRRIEKYAMMTIVCMFALWTAGCAGPGFTPDNTAKTFFETYQVSPNYRYYITGSDTYPVAILALHKSYKMGNDLWKELEITPALLDQTVTNMQNQLLTCCMQTQAGFKVYDSTGKQIGLLYSFLGVGLSFRVDDQGFVHIAGPRDDDQLKNYQGRTPSPN